MTWSFRKYLWLPACAGLLLLAACQAPATLSPEVTSEELQAEKTYQQEQMEKVRAQGGMPQTWHRKKGVQAQFDRVAERVEKAGADICREIGLPAQQRSCYYYFVLSSNRDINAAADGTNIIIPMGMMRFVAGDDELAHVMAHELTHNLMRHHDAKTTNALVGAVFGAVLDAAVVSQGGGANNGFANAGRDIGAISYSPSFEREADYMGAYIAARAGYDTRRASDFWRRLSYQAPDGANGGLTHPANAERFIALNKTVTEIKYKRKQRLPLVPNLQSPTQ